MDAPHSPINISIPLTYDMFFDDKPKEIIEYLRGIGRHKLVELALYTIKLRIKSEIWKSWAKILIGRRFRQYPQKV